MRHKGDGDVLAAELGECLLDLGRVAVTGDLVGVEALVQLGKMVALRGLSACAGHAAFAVADDALGADKTVDDRRRDGKRRTGGVAAGIGDQALSLDLVAEEFGQTVNALRVQLLVQKGAAVPFGVGVLALKAEVGAEVDKGFSGRHALRRQLLRESVRQGGKNDVALLDNSRLILANHII